MLMFVSVGRARPREKVTGFWDNTPLTAQGRTSVLVSSRSASFRVVEVTKWPFNFFRLNANRITPLIAASRAINCGELRH